MAMMKRRREKETGVQADAAEEAKKQKLATAGGSKYINKQRVLVFSSRGITTRYRHLMDDFRKLLPHHKREVKLDAKDTLHVVNEIAEIKGCNTTIFLEARKRQDLYMWVSRVGTGPSVKFLVQNGSWTTVCVHYTAHWTWKSNMCVCVWLFGVTDVLYSAHNGRAQDDGQCIGWLSTVADI